MDRDGLADFLRRRRETLRPDDVGLGLGRRRRTPGLRREEVAALAHMSTDFYTRLEQRRGSRPSEQTIGALARALRLTLDERDHLLQLAGFAPPPRARRSEHVSPALLRVLDRLDAPAQVVSDLGRPGAAAGPGPARRAGAGRLGPGGDAGPDPAGRGAASGAAPVPRAGAQHVLPVVHGHRGAQPLPRRGPRAARPALRRELARRR